MKAKKVGKLVVLISATAALVATIISDKKVK